jgi:hypothetical protein
MPIALLSPPSYPHQSRGALRGLHAANERQQCQSPGHALCSSLFIWTSAAHCVRQVSWESANNMELTPLPAIVNRRRHGHAGRWVGKE